MILEISLTDGAPEGVGPQIRCKVGESDLALSPADFMARFIEPSVHVILNWYADKNAPEKSEEVIPSTAAVEAPATPGKMTFESALVQMKGGSKVAREGWKDRWLAFDDKFMPHLCQMPERAIWEHAKEDLTARDWVVV